jgi:2-phospho-L-lactate/phosphoenolpyruvate guanylyltransferase
MNLTVLGDLARGSARRRGACALIAIKERAHCKTRLAEALAPLERIELARSMLTTVICAARGAQLVHQVIVISPERDTVPADVPVLADTGESLNDALVQAHTMVLEFGCREVVVLPADLPKITSLDIDALIRAARIGGFAIAPDTAGVGTNALCLVSPLPFDFQFGPESARLHLQAAQRIGSSPQVVRLPGLELDVDSPADLELLDEHRWHTCLRA